MLQESMFVGSRHGVNQLAKMYDKLVAVVEVDSSTWRIIWDDGKEVPLAERLATIRQQRLSAEAKASTLPDGNVR